MKVILVNGSPHKKGCTYTALNEVAKALNNEGIDTQFFWLGLEPVAGCTACNSCASKKKCRFDDCVNEFLSVATDADGFVFGSPVHFAAASGTVTSFMDRVFYINFQRGRELFYLKPAAAVVSAERSGTTAALDQLNKYFTFSEMPVISSRYWNMVHGSTPRDVKQDLEGLQTMRTLGMNMAFFLRCREAGLRDGVKFPLQETIVHTNFIRE